MPVATAYFTPATFRFLGELAANNNRDWFQANKARYERDVRDPMLRFITDLKPRLARICPYVVVDPRPVGGSMHRINRDIRFSADKSPYRTSISAVLRHEAGREMTAPALYVRIAPGDSLAGGGVHAPDTATLGRIRDAIVRESAAWKRATGGKRFAPLRLAGMPVLKRVPQGYDPGHPLAEDLKQKLFYWGLSLTDREVVAPDLMDRYVEACRAAAPYNRFLAAALGVPW